MVHGRSYEVPPLTNPSQDLDLEIPLNASLKVPSRQLSPREPIPLQLTRLSEPNLVRRVPHWVLSSILVVGRPRHRGRRVKAEPGPHGHELL